METPTAGPTFNEALGMAINQQMFAAKMTRVDLGKILGLSASMASRKLHGVVKWTAEDLAILADVFGVTMNDLSPVRTTAGWMPAAYVPGQQKTPALASTGVSVAGEGLEPSTSRL